MLDFFSSSDTTIKPRSPLRVHFANSRVFFEIQMSRDLSFDPAVFAAIKISLLSLYLFNAFNEILRVNTMLFFVVVPPPDLRACNEFRLAPLLRENNGLLRILPSATALCNEQTLTAASAFPERWYAVDLPSEHVGGVAVPFDVVLWRGGGEGNCLVVGEDGRVKERHLHKLVRRCDDLCRVWHCVWGVLGGLKVRWR